MPIPRAAWVCTKGLEKAFLDYQFSPQIRPDTLKTVISKSLFLQDICNMNFFKLRGSFELMGIFGWWGNYKKIKKLSMVPKLWIFHVPMKKSNLGKRVFEAAGLIQGETRRKCPYEYQRH